MTCIQVSGSITSCSDTVFKARLDGALGLLIWWQEDWTRWSSRPLQPKPFCDLMTRLKIPQKTVQNTTDFICNFFKACFLLGPISVMISEQFNLTVLVFRSYKNFALEQRILQLLCNNMLLYFTIKFRIDSFMTYSY